MMILKYLIKCELVRIERASWRITLSIIFENHICLLLHFCTLQLCCNGGSVYDFHPWRLMIWYMPYMNAHSGHLSTSTDIRHHTMSWLWGPEDSSNHDSGETADFNRSATTVWGCQAWGWARMSCTFSAWFEVLHGHTHIVLTFQQKQETSWRYRSAEHISDGDAWPDSIMIRN